jgi:hypothetical protein
MPTERTISLDAEENVDAGPMTASMSAIATANAQSISATGSAIATARTSSLTTTASAVGLAQVDGDSTVSLSAVPLMVTRGNAEFKQAYASAFIAGGDVSVSQGGAPLIAGKTVDIEMGGGGVLLAREARISHGWVGVLLSADAEISDDTKIVMTTRIAMILVAALLGGFGLVALGLYFGARRLSEWKPDFRLWKH